MIDIVTFRPPRETAPAIVLLAAIFGMNREMCALAQRYAQRGYFVVAPDLFARTHPGPLERTPEGRQLAMDRKARFDVARGIDDVLDAIAYARSAVGSSGKVAVIGFCFGGRFAYYAAGHSFAIPGAREYDPAAAALMEERVFARLASLD